MFQGIQIVSFYSSGLFAAKNITQFVCKQYTVLQIFDIFPAVFKKYYKSGRFMLLDATKAEPFDISKNLWSAYH